MPSTEARDFSAPNETRKPPKTTIELVKLGEGEIARYTFEPGWRWSECIKPIAGTDHCQTEHVGYCLTGELHIKDASGTEVHLKAGDVYHILPGHDAWNAGSVPTVMVEFQGATTFARC